MPILSMFTSTLLASRLHRESDTRVDLLPITGRAIVEHPLAGIGWREFPDHSERLLGRGFNTHDEYIRIAAEAGLPALVLLALLVWWALRSPVRFREDWVAKALLPGGLTSVAFANSMSNPATCLPIWCALGTLLVGPHSIAAAGQPSTEQGRPPGDAVSTPGPTGDKSEKWEDAELNDRTLVALPALAPRPTRPAVPPQGADRTR